MKYLMRAAKAIPWVLLGRLSVRAIVLLGTAILAVMVLCGKALALYIKYHSLDKNEPDPNEKLFDIGTYPSRPDLDPFRP